MCVSLLCTDDVRGKPADEEGEEKQANDGRCDGGSVINMRVMSSFVQTT